MHACLRNRLPHPCWSLFLHRSKVGKFPSYLPDTLTKTLLQDPTIVYHVAPISIKLGTHTIHQVNNGYFKRCHQLSFLLLHELDHALFQPLMHIMVLPDRLHSSGTCLALLQEKVMYKWQSMLSLENKPNVHHHLIVHLSCFLIILNISLYVLMYSL